MTRLSASTGVLPLVTSIAVAAALSGGAVLAVLQSGCDDPGYYRTHDGVVELIGGCLEPGDLPVRPRHPVNVPHPAGTDPSIQP
ncbi:hypothetical protein GCM10011581_03810 [Saccharopolyspora subtropica]|uniref:Secreted protein n=1 Tax=Saccharopolyspora thermophila TaxID=89367 RepID=A0A917JIJ3_9PSEU|nr:hypothetical protein [Saccharopolyspora subtropica]GGI70006.1 hypothetical protein GCM10011581_03810 [Saccharopolyspora subtropica]